MAQNLSDLELRSGPGEPLPPDRPRAAMLWILAAVLLAAAGFAGYYYLNRPAPPPEAAATKPAPAAAPSRGALGRDPMAVDLPPLDQSDEVVRKLVSTLTSNPTVAAWLATDGLVRNFAVVVSNVAEDDPPAVHLSRFRPAGRFAIIERNGEMTIDPRSYQRYTALTTAVTAMDPDGAARLYATLKPLLEQANRDLGHGNTSFDATLEHAIVTLLQTPRVRDPIRVVPKGIGYAFDDDRLEALTPAQKHLLRMGPANAQAVQQALRNIAAALGIPKERLPG